jgi:hypothetical protein
MPVYQIHRLKETPRQQFRWAPHAPGVSIVKLRDYEPGQRLEAASPYALWLALRETDDALQIGDLLQLDGQEELRIFKYIGFEEARWYVPEPAPASLGAASAVE